MAVSTHNQASISIMVKLKITFDFDLETS